jgi:AcrR family transcriptional regulator
VATIDVLERQFPGRRAALKRDILQAALACFNEAGIEATTIEAIRTRCDTSVGNLYHHFGSKEGVVAALFFAAIDDQQHAREVALAKAGTLQEGVYAQVFGFVDWVVAQPEWARFQFQARSLVSGGDSADALRERNRQRNRQFRARVSTLSDADLLARLPAELVPSLIVGQAESYCRAWIAGRVQTSPDVFRDTLAKAAWASLMAALPP